MCCITMELRQHGQLAVLPQPPALQKLEMHLTTTTASLVNRFTQLKRLVLFTKGFAMYQKDGMV